ncbi:MAG: hypothetical protein COZ06_12240 [Armatimonadetes bacterium CG_4_10_14_3_um_filter_66_18]|nr:tetratricopeptide repeat protein [Armatimonadota bacterium]OIP04147.1 MAG: hypothetical protein AUJ96_13495 [Armatimonadetes bacterium CG2_30_66_41]PIU90146.1 MAG: hypothetical protein COS65_26110 [Armatimonadetes bacterium CG06_land_8_20_14_3_00_66_21]PIX37715.1 MAG: hypothetical protein COZ57_32955 [Armatimonadetes bacterium CG_4_8_14_3_um_filter_66_20]PIY49876.1 MAG: hypothetical protein COZ06_12240 [Armatimonadetes bacterium CG_4_10_14_3_um_filter_66_18]PIZ30891.1 MAG: hypothetical prot
MYAQGFGSAIFLAIAIATCCLCMAIPGLVLVNAWLVNKSIGGGTALCLMVALGGMFGMIIGNWGKPVSFVLLALLLLSCALSPWVAARLDKAGLARLDNEDMRKYQLALQHDPKNAAAHSFLAQLYLKQKRYDDAIEHFQLSLEAYAESPKDRHLLQRAIDEKQRAEAEGPVCAICGAINPPGAKTCGACDQLFKEPGFLHWLVQPENLKPVVRTSIAACVLVMLVGSVLSSLPRGVGVSLLFMTLTGAAGYLWVRL